MKTKPNRRQALERLAMAASASALTDTWAAEASVTAPLLSKGMFPGAEFSTQALQGKVILINFWATWCAPCRAEMPEIDAYYKAHRGQGLEVLALSVDERADEPKVREVALAYAFPVAMMKASTLTGFGRIWRMPVSAVIDRKGQIVKKDWFVEPKLDAAALDAVIQPLL